MTNGLEIADGFSARKRGVADHVYDRVAPERTSRHDTSSSRVPIGLVAATVLSTIRLLSVVVAFFPLSVIAVVLFVIVIVERSRTHSSGNSVSRDMTRLGAL